MIARILRIELRRSAAPWAALVSIPIAISHREVGQGLSTVAGIVVAALVAATAVTGMQLVPVERVIRDVIGMSGLIALGTVVIGAGKAWILPLTWTLVAMQRPPSPTPTYRAVLTWMLQSPATTSATVTALILGTAGVLAYAILGPRS